MLEIFNSVVYNNVIRMYLPLAVIITSYICIRNAKEISAYLIIASLILNGIAVYLVLPEFTVADSEKTIQKKLPEVVKLELIENTPVDTNAVFAPNWFYTYQVTESNGVGYILMFNPKNGEFFERN